MKKVLLGLTLVLFCIPLAFATIITNTNQSTHYLRMLARNASTDIDAVYYNPAGLTQLSDGFHIAIHNQTIWQEKTVVNAFPFLNDSEYVGEVNVPFFPSVFVVYKKEKLALSFGFGPNSGGGTADFASGLPSFTVPISQIPPALSNPPTGIAIPTTGYQADVAFNGKSVYYGFQINASYAFSEMVSAAGGLRYIYASNTYEGHIKSILINPNFPAYGLTGDYIPATQFFTLIGNPYYAAMTSDKVVDAKQTATGFTPILGLFLKPAEELNIGIRYEFNTSLEFENDTTQDDVGLFPDGEKSRNDIPAILSLGLEYSLMPELRVMVSTHMFFDKSANWEGREDLVDSNSYDIAIGLEYDITDTILISGGYLYTQVGLSENYLNDLSYELDSSAFGFGGQVKIAPELDLDVGVIYVNYSDDSKNILYPPNFGTFNETYKKTSWGFSVGLGYGF
jgi:long-chain fatty acid transport protein